MPDASGSVDLGSLSAEEREAVEKLAEDTGAEPGKHPALFAFLVIADPAGNVSFYAYDGPETAPDLDVAMKLSTDLVYGAAATIQKDIAAQETATHTVQVQMAQAQAFAEQQRQAQLQAQLGDLRGSAAYNRG